MILGSNSMPIPRPILVFALVLAAFVYGDEARAQSCPEFSKRVAERTVGEHQGTRDLLVIGDFDGNGEPDRAFFAEIDGRFPLVVCLHGQAGAIQVTKGSSSVANLGIRLADPGAYNEACVKGYGPDCRPGQKVKLELDGSAIIIFQYESFSTIFYWEGNRFEKFPLTD